MQFIGHSSGPDRKVSRAPQTHRSPRRNRAQVGVESMEGRNLLSAISMTYGQINITAPQASGNQAHVWNDGNNIDVWVDGEFAQFDRSQVYSVSYTGGGGGSDTFQNQTSLNGVLYGYGGNNHFYGGGGFSTVYLLGGNNTYDSWGRPSYVFMYDTGDNVNTSYGNVEVTDYNNVPITFAGWFTTPAPDSPAQGATAPADPNPDGGTAGRLAASSPPAKPVALSSWQGWSQFLAVWQGWSQYPPRSSVR